MTATVAADNPGMDRATAESVVLEALKFVATAAGGAGDLTPSRLVDKGWHALILHTHLYKTLCTTVGTFVDHYPNPSVTGSGDLAVIERTITSIEKAGFRVDRQLWIE
ncbi:hypothetical protein [Streptomyces sp. NPDC048606]|uniref:hypothetical protein n=1 Tax=Streptomyces sp. NPDC048606 TaxID=3154726 RepID=UPI003428A8BF